MRVVRSLLVAVVAVVAAVAVSLSSGAVAYAWAPGDPTELSLTAAPSAVVPGQRVTLAGRLTDPASGAGIGGAAVRVEARDPSSQEWVAVSDAVTSADGRLAVALAPGADTTYRLHHGDPGAPEESVSPPVAVTVSRLTAALSRAAVRVGRPVSVRGVLAAPRGAVVRLERRVGAAWVLSSTTRTADDGSYRFTVTPDRAGWWRWRVRRGAHGLVASLPAVDVFRLHTYAVTTRGVVTLDVGRFRRVVAETYADPRGWLRAHHRFREVPRGGAFTIVLSAARELRSFSGGCSTSYSCRVGRFVIINARRWAHGSPHFTGDLATYRAMLVNHETGHWLGLGHAACPRAGARAPVMQQQSKGLHGCRPNAWPLPREVSRVS